MTITSPPGATWIEKNYYQLPFGEWVAANDQGLLGHHPDLVTLVEIVKLNEVRPEGVLHDPTKYTIQFIREPSLPRGR